MVDVRSVSVLGDFDSIPVGDGEHWTTKTEVVVLWHWRPHGDYPWLAGRIDIPAGFRWDGASRPDFVGWVIPRGGVFLLASCVHDYCFKNRPELSDGMRISRQHTDMLYLALMEKLAAERVNSGWKARAQAVLARVMWRAVRWFGEPVWDKHDEEYRVAG